MRYIVELPGMTIETAKAAMQVLRKDYGWAGVFRLDQEKGDGTYKLLGPNPFGTVPLAGTLQIKDVNSKEHGSWPCALNLDIQPGVEGMGLYAELAFLRARDAFVQQLPLSIHEVAREIHELD